jgi:hypothetical protein
MKKAIGDKTIRRHKSPAKKSRCDDGALIPNRMKMIAKVNNKAEYLNRMKNKGSEYLIIFILPLESKYERNDG